MPQKKAYHYFRVAHGKYTITLRDTGRVDSYRHALVEYQLIAPFKRAIFAGDDLGIPYGANPTGREAAYSLLAFLTLKPGDTDADFFASYTPEQLTWADGPDCEELSLAVYDHENKS